MNDKYTESDIHIRGRLAQKLDHFWFYYKWHTIIALFAVFVLTVCFVQSCSKIGYDVAVLYAGPYEFNTGESELMASKLNEVLPRDFNKDGEKHTLLIGYRVLSEEQINDLKKQTIDDIEAELRAENPQKEVDRDEIAAGMIFDTSYFANQSSLYHSAIMTGEYAILLLDPVQFQTLISLEGRLRDLTGVFPTLPENAENNYGIRFSETALYQNSKELSRLPKDTILCILSPVVLGTMSNSANYAKATEMFVAMAAPSEKP